MRRSDHQPVEAGVADDDVAAAAEDRDRAVACRAAQRNASTSVRVVVRLHEPARGAAQLERGARRERHALCAARALLRPRAQRITSSPPMYGTSACGTRTLPSACWYCSRIATSVRPIASPSR